MGDTTLAAVCGLYCGACGHLGGQCTGCGNQEGKPFWTAMMKVEACPLYDCCRNKKQLEHCGLCRDLPCETFLEMRDPAASPEEAEKSLLDRQTDLERRRQVGTEAWLRSKDAAAG